MKFVEFLNEDKMTSISLKVREELSFEARKAINEWEHSNWIGGRLEKEFDVKDILWFTNDKKYRSREYIVKIKQYLQKLMDKL